MREWGRSTPSEEFGKRILKRERHGPFSVYPAGFIMLFCFSVSVKARYDTLLRDASIPTVQAALPAVFRCLPAVYLVGLSGGSAEALSPDPCFQRSSINACNFKVLSI